MKKRSPISSNVQGPITRARAKALGTLGEVFPSSRPSFKQDQRQSSRANSKRAAADGNKTPAPRHKRKTALKDVTNIIDGNSSQNCRGEMDIQLTGRQLTRSPDRSSSASRSNMLVEITLNGVNAKLSGNLSRTSEDFEGISSPRSIGENEPSQKSPLDYASEGSISDPMLLIENSRKDTEMQSPEKIEEDGALKRMGDLSYISIPEIDSYWRDLRLFCSEIYNNYSGMEINLRPSSDYMEKIQQDITPTMRRILVDWLVEVAEELEYVPDTLYLSVNIIDRFLSQASIHRRRLQLLGVTCMLIASKYEEICASGVDDFCVMMDKAHTRQEVLEMERQVLNLLHFKLTVPTIKTFLRRFVRAAHASYKGPPCIELELLANYLAELALMEYKFLKYLPSLVAASAVFLAGWTLNQSDNPWNPVLEHYTSYMASDLKTAVLELEELQLNTRSCSLDGVRGKYKKEKFKRVATLTSEKRAIFLF